MKKSALNKDILRYGDMNGNNYKIDKETFHYDPITEAESSSGTYSGGEPKKFTIAEEDYKEIYKVFKESFLDTACHTEMRTKGSGRLKMYDEESQTYKSCLLRYNSFCQKKLEGVLKDMKEKG